MSRDAGRAYQGEHRGTRQQSSEDQADLVSRPSRYWAGRGLWSGFLMGLGAIPTLYSVDFSPPRYRSAGVAGDWQAVGTDIRNAMRGHEERS